MNKTLILISFTALLLQVLINAFLVFNSRWTKVSNVGLSLVHAVSSVVSLVLLLDTPAPLPFVWTIDWFKFSEISIFKLSFSTEVWSNTLWVFASTYAFLNTYFEVIGENRSYLGSDLSKALVSSGVFLGIISGNFITYFYGWGLVGFGQFVGVALCGVTNDGPISKVESNQAVRLYTVTLLCDLILVAGMLGLTNQLGSATFLEIKESEYSGWFTLATLLGVSCRLFLPPFLGLAKYLTGAGMTLIPNVLQGSVLMSAVFLSKMSGAKYGIEITTALLFLSSVAALLAAIKSLAETSLSTVFGWVSAYFCATVLSASFAGGWVSVHYEVFGALVALWLLYFSVEFMPTSSRARRILEIISGVLLLAPPFTVLGQARYFDYYNVMNLTEGNSLMWVLIFIKGLADLIMGVLGWKIIKGYHAEVNVAKSRIQEARWIFFVPAVISSLFGIAPILGGRIFSGWYGEVEEEVFGATMWLERSISNGLLSQVTFSAENNTVIIVRLLCIGSLILAALISLLWFERDRNASREMHKKWKSIARLTNIDGAFDYLIWDFIGPRVIQRTAIFTANMDQKASLCLGRGMRVSGEYFSKLLRYTDIWITDNVIDASSIKIFSILSRLTRRAHGGGVIFLLGFGMLMMSLALFRFYLHEGK